MVNITFIDESKMIQEDSDDSSIANINVGKMRSQSQLNNKRGSLPWHVQSFLPQKVFIKDQ